MLCLKKIILLQSLILFKDQSDQTVEEAFKWKTDTHTHVGAHTRWVKNDWDKCKKSLRKSDVFREIEEVVKSKVKMPRDTQNEVPKNHTKTSGK